MPVMRRPLNPLTGKPMADPSVADIAGLLGPLGIPVGAIGMAARLLRAFHGSPKRSLSTILANPVERQFDNATSQLGAFFAPTREGAARYAGDAGRIYEADLLLENPYEMPWGMFSKLQNPTRVGRRAVPPAEWDARAQELAEAARRLRRRLVARGHDGIVVNAPRGPVELVSFHDVPVGGK